MPDARAFSNFVFDNGFIAECDPNFPSYLSAWNEQDVSIDEADDTHYGYVHRGSALVTIGGHVFPAYQGMVFCAPGQCLIRCDDGGQGVIVSRRNWQGVPTLSGPIEHEGRLKYVDGCTDSLLICPPKFGDPCLNLLYFPPGIDQTRHTHPSDRIGLILSGRGRCHYWNWAESTEMIVDLEAGMLFRIHAEGHHKFSTPYGEEMRVLAFHPDSDFGATDEDHPMINRTMIDGISASLIEEIHTR